MHDAGDGCALKRPLKAEDWQDLRDEVESLRGRCTAMARPWSTLGARLEPAGATVAALRFAGRPERERCRAPCEPSQSSSPFTRLLARCPLSQRHGKN